MSLLVNIIITIFLGLNLVQEVHSFTSFSSCQSLNYQVPQENIDSNDNWNEIGHLTNVHTCLRTHINHVLTVVLQKQLTQSLIGSAKQSFQLYQTVKPDQIQWLYLDHHSLLI